MSRFRVLLVERLGAPDPSWPSIFGPTDGADPIVANGLRTLDVSPSLEPIANLDAQIERDLAAASYSGLDLDLFDKDGSLGDAVGPASATLGTPTRYYGPWVQIWEDWGTPTQSVLRFLGYVDETSIEWDEENAETKVSVKHASELLRERLLTDFPELLRPYPIVPTVETQSFAATTADDALHATVATYTPRASKATIESALWASGKLTWYASTERIKGCVNVHGSVRCTTDVFDPPLPPALTLIIAGTPYMVESIAWNTSISASWEDPITPPTLPGYFQDTYTVMPMTITLAGAPNLTGILNLGDTVSWGIVESQRTHYLIPTGVIPAPTSGSDGPKSVQLNTVEGLVPGDVLTLTFTDTTSGAQRQTTADLPPIIDLDGETGLAYLLTPLTQGYPSISKVRRNSQDPVLFEGVTYAQAICAPFELDADYFIPAKSQSPIPCWRAYDTDGIMPELYGAHGLQTLDAAGTLQLARRGADNGAGAYTTPGLWQGNWDTGWSWQGLPTPHATHDVYGDALQWPGAAAPFKPPILYQSGDLSGGATIPINGWRNAWRSYATPDDQIQVLESYWDGTVIQWAAHAAAGYIPALLVAWSAASPSPGRYKRTSGGSVTFEPLTGDRTLGSPVSITPSGSPPASNWHAWGMGIFAHPVAGHSEALMGLSAPSSTGPWTTQTACLESIGTSGALTVIQTPTLTADAAGHWGLGGGLAACTWTETRGGDKYPRTRLWLADGRATPLAVDFLTLEIIPQSIQPLQLAGTGAGSAISGWQMLGIETFLDAQFHPSRRLRFLWVDATLTVLNGDLEPDPADPTNVVANFRRGTILSSAVPDGALIARMVRTGTTSDTMAGQIGGRLFTVDRTIPHTVERLKVGGAALSGDGLSVMDFLEKFAATRMANALPASDGSMRLVSRNWGQLRIRTGILTGFGVGVQASEVAKPGKVQTAIGYIRSARVTYDDLLSDTSETEEVLSARDGGQVLDIDYSDLVSGQAMASALATAAVTFFGNPLPVYKQTWVDRAYGVDRAKAPAFFADWQLGDIVPEVPVALGPGAGTVTARKIVAMKPGLEARSVDVELIELPVPVPADGSTP